MPAANISDQAIPCAPRSTAASAPALWMNMNPSADAPSRQVAEHHRAPAIEPLHQRRDSGIVTRLATPNAAMTAPIWPAVAP